MFFIVSKNIQEIKNKTKNAGFYFFEIFKYSLLKSSLFVVVDFKSKQ
jgi:hypothetical protein